MPTATPISRVNDFVIRFANVNGSGSASANEMFARAVMRMGVPVAPRNIFPSNIQGLPTWYEVRVSEAGHLGARGGTDLMVAMNPQTFDRDIAGIEPGGYLFYDSTKPLPSVEIPRRHYGHRCAADRDLQSRIHRSAPAPAVQEHHLYRRADRPARHRCEGRRATHWRAIQRQGQADRAQPQGAAYRPRLRDPQFAMPARHQAASAPTPSATAFSSRATPPPRWARSMAAPPSAPGIRSRHRPRSPTPLPVTAPSCASTRRPSRPNTRSSRPRTSSPRLAS